MDVEIKCEPLTPRDRDLCAAFRSAHGVPAGVGMTQAGLGRFASYMRDKQGLCASEAAEIAHRAYFDEHPVEGLVYHFLAALDGQGASAGEIIKHMTYKTGLPRKEIVRAVQNAAGGICAFAVYNDDARLRLRRKGESLPYWP